MKRSIIKIVLAGLVFLVSMVHFRPTYAGNKSCTTIFENLAEMYYQNESFESLELKRNYVLLHPNKDGALELLESLGKRNIPILSQRSPEYWQLLKSYRARLRSIKKLRPSEHLDLDWISNELSDDSGSEGFFWHFKSRYLPTYCGKKARFAVAIDTSDSSGDAARQATATLVHELTHLVFSQDLSSSVASDSLFYYQTRVEDHRVTWASGNIIKRDELNAIHDAYDFIQEFVAFSQQAKSYDWLGVPQGYSGRSPTNYELVRAIEWGYSEEMPRGLLGFACVTAIIEHKTGKSFSRFGSADFLAGVVTHLKRTDPAQQLIWSAIASGKMHIDAIDATEEHRDFATKVLNRAHQMVRKVKSIDPTDELLSYYFLKKNQPLLPRLDCEGFYIKCSQSVNVNYIRRIKKITPSKMVSAYTAI